MDAKTKHLLVLWSGFQHEAQPEHVIALLLPLVLLLNLTIGVDQVTATSTYTIHTGTKIRDPLAFVSSDLKHRYGSEAVFVIKVCASNSLICVCCRQCLKYQALFLFLPICISINL